MPKKPLSVQQKKKTHTTSGLDRGQKGGPEIDEKTTSNQELHA